MIDEDEFNCSARVLREVFSEEKLVIIYRFSMEVDKARGRIDLNVKPPSERGTANVSESHGGSHILGVVGDPGIYMVGNRLQNICTLFTIMLKKYNTLYLIQSQIRQNSQQNGMALIWVLVIGKQ